ncbi:hypothetical protein ACFY3O_30320 [Streptomyces sp. NPDC001046]|uniref:hypothetical protein n=1 Tax=unclassified Streptomyces TaxID=2593676 RepID=UPI0035D66E23
MRIRGRALRYTAVSALVVLALTGFSTGRGGGGGHGGDGGGGGCSSSSQDHDSSSSSGSGGAYGSDDTYDDDDDQGTGGATYTRRPDHGSAPTSSPGSGSGRALEDGTARLVSCATPSAPYATVEVSNPNGRTATFSVSVTFVDGSGITVVDRRADVTVPGQDKALVRVEVGAGLVDSVDDCRADRQALVEG